MAEVGRFRRHGRPFDFSRGVPVLGRYPPDGLSIAEAIEAIRHSPVEIGYGFDTDDQQMFRQVGTHDEIRGFDPRDLAAIANGTLVHNHPPYAEFAEGDPRQRAGSFSPRDLVFAYEFRLAALIAVSRERTYFLRRHADGFFLDPDQITEEYTSRRRLVVSMLRLQATRGIISPEDVLSEGRIADEVMKLLGTFFKYQWEEVD